MTRKIIFDRSAFHGGNFESIQKSNLKNLVDDGIICVYFTVAFWEETSRLARTNKDELKKQLLYLLSIDTYKWFRPIENIIEAEVKNGRRLEDDFYVFTQEEIALKQKDFIDIAHGNLDISQAIDEHEKKFILR